MGDGQQSGVKVGEIGADDFEELCAIIAEVDAFHREALPGLFQKVDGPARDRAYIQDLIDREDVGLFGAWVDDQLAGYLHAVVLPESDFAIVVPRKVVLVDGLAVAGTFRKRGLGRLLMAHAEAFARDIGAAGLELKVYAFNANAMALYESLGYSTRYHGMTKDLD